MVAKAHFEVYLDRRKAPRFRLRAPNGEIVLVSEAYSSKQQATDGVGAVKKYAVEADIQDLTK